MIVAAADTFRAAAIEQLEVWCERAGVEMIIQKQGSDPAAVAFDAVKAGGRAQGGSTVLIDTAGRLQTKVNLMEELKKIARVAGRELPGAPHEILAGARCDHGAECAQPGENLRRSGTSDRRGSGETRQHRQGRGGNRDSRELKLPVRFVGVGENIEDLREFDPREFVQALFPRATG